MKWLTGLACFCVLFSSVNVAAETGSSIVENSGASTEADVVVGGVEAPVYSVEFEWDDMLFDWKYDEETSSFRWMASTCEALQYNANDLENTFAEHPEWIYADNFCLTPISSDLTLDELRANLDKYYYSTGEEVNREIRITDTSRYGRITPYIEWNSSEGYDWTVGKFFYDDNACIAFDEDLEEAFYSSLQAGFDVFTDSSCSNVLTDTNVEFEKDKYYSLNLGTREFELTTTQIPDSIAYNPGDGFWYYDLRFALDIDANKAISTPKSGDVIGKITIAVR